jgi:hypothetical protein
MSSSTISWIGCSLRPSDLIEYEPQDKQGRTLTAAGFGYRICCYIQASAAENTAKFVWQARPFATYSGLSNDTIWAAQNSDIQTHI